MVNQCDGLIYEESEYMRTDAISIRTYGECLNNSALYDIDNNVKYSLTCNKDRVLYAKNPHYRWKLCTLA